MANFNLQKYTRCLVSTPDKGTLLEEVSVTLRRNTNAQNVITVAKGFAGQSPGAPMCEVSCESAVPEGGFEWDLDDQMGELKTVDITLHTETKTLTMKVFITDDNFSHAANTPSKLTFNGVGAYPGKWQDA